MGSLNIVMFYGSVRPDRMGIRFVKFLRHRLETAGHSVILFDAMEMKLPLLEKPMHFYSDQSLVPENLQMFNKQILKADGFLIVNGEYNHTIQPGLTNMLDHFPPKSYAFKPCVIAPYSLGSMAASVSTSHMREVAAELRMAVVPKTMQLGQINKHLDENGEPINPELIKRSEVMINEFVWYCEALKNQRKTGTPS